MSRLKLGRAALLAVCVSFFVAAPSSAKTVRVVGGTPTITMDIPDGWTSASVRRGVEVKSADQEIFFWVESYAEADFQRVKGEHSRYFAGEGVEVIGEPKTSAKPYGTYAVATVDIPAAWKGKPTVLRYILVEPADESKRRLMVSYWASPEGHEAHAATMNMIVNSLAKSVDAAN